MQVAGCGIWDFKFPSCSPTNCLPQFFFNHPMCAAFTTTIDLLLDADLTNLRRFITVLATSVADPSWTVRSSSANSIPAVHSRKDTLMADNPRYVLIDQRIDQSSLRSSRVISLTLLCMHIWPISTIQAII